MSTLRFGGRRRAFRRDAERQGQYVDHIPTHLAAVVVSIFVMSAADAACTLVHIARGGSEANPAMSWTLLHGITVFLVVKAVMTTLGVTFLAMHQNFRSTVPILYLLMCCYGFLMGFHVFVSQP